MKVQVGQILLPEPEAIVSPLQMAAVLTLIGIMAAVLVEVLVAPAVLHIPALLIAVHRPADAAAVGLILARALANKLRRKDATMCRRPAAETDFIGMLLPVPAVNQPQHLAQELAAVPDHAPPDLIG